MGDVLKEGTDMLSVHMAFLTIRAVRRSVTHQFSYCICKLENIDSIAIGVIKMAREIFVTIRAKHHFSHPIMPEGKQAGIAIFALYA